MSRKSDVCLWGLAIEEESLSSANTADRSLIPFMGSTGALLYWDDNSCQDVEGEF